MAIKRRYWAVIPPMPAAALAAATQQCEALGLEGIWSTQPSSCIKSSIGAAEVA